MNALPFSVYAFVVRSRFGRAVRGHVTTGSDDVIAVTLILLT